MNKLRFEAEIKLVGDAYTSGFANGMTMGVDSGSMPRFSIKEDSDSKTVYETEDGLTMVSYHEKCGDTVTCYTTVENNGEKQVTMEMLTSFAIRKLKVDKVYRLMSNWSAEGKLKVETINDLHLEKSWNGCAVRVEKFGTLGSMPVRKWFPFVAVEDAETGEFTAVQLYSPSSWQMEIKCKHEELYDISGGIADRDFGHWTKTLKPGERYVSSKAVVANGKSLLEACDKLVKAQNPRISPEDSNMDIVFNEYCTTWGNPTFENVKKICDKIAGKGIKFLVIDSGWYGDAENWWDMVGDWRVNEKRFPGGMKPIADYIRSKGMVPGLWWEMENITSGAEQFHYDNVLKRDGYPITVGNRRFWDMEDERTISYLSESVIGRLRDSGFGYVKIDYNDTIGMGCDGPEGFGENLRNKVLATQRFFKKMADEVPGLVIENCSSGGHRLEASMMELVSQASFSDAHETKAIPIIAANVQRVIKPSQSQIWAVLRASDDENRINYSLCSTLLGRMCLSGDIYDLSDAQWQQVSGGIEFYKKVSDIIRDGSTVILHQETDGYNNPTGSQLVVRKLGDRALVVFHRFEDSESIEKVSEKCGFDLARAKVLDSFGCAEEDFSAKALLIEY